MYYYLNGEWQSCAAPGAYRFALPADFAGYVYMPLTAYSQYTGTATPTTGFADTVSAGYKYLAAAYVFMGGCDKYGDVAVDNFYLVK